MENINDSQASQEIVDLQYTVVNHRARKELKITVFEYCIFDSIYNLSNNPKYKNWCIAGLDHIADFIGCNEKTVRRTKEKGLNIGVLKIPMDRRGVKDNRIATTQLWYDTAILGMTRTKCPDDPDKMSSKKTSDPDKMSSYNNKHNKETNNNNPPPVKNNIEDGSPAQNPVVVALELRSVLEDYRRLELSFTEKQIKQHINKYGSDVVSGALKHFEENVDSENVKSIKAYFMWILNNYEIVRPIPEPEKIPARVLTDNEKELEGRSRKIKDIETRIYNGKYGSGFNQGEDEKALDLDLEKAIKELEDFKTTMQKKGLYPANEVITSIAGKMGRN